MKSKILFGLSLVLLSLASCSPSNASSAKPSTSTKDSTSEKTSTSTPDKASTSESTATKSTYDVKVTYPDATPVADTYVQWCTATMCEMPVKTGSDGTASMSLTDGPTYYVHVPEAPAGYTYDANLTKEDSSNRHLDIVLLALGTIGDNNTISASGVYQSSFSSNVSSITYTLSLPAGSYTIFSFNDYSPASLTATLDPSITLKQGDTILGTDNDSGGDKNFSLTFTAADAASYSMTIDCASSTLATLPFKIALKA